MSRAKFIKGAKVLIDGAQWTFLRLTATDIWQLEKNDNGELKRFSRKELFNLYLVGRFRFVEEASPSTADGRQKRSENAIVQFESFPEELRTRAKYRRQYVNALLSQLGPSPSRALSEIVIRKEWEKIRQPERPPHYVTVWRWLKRYQPAGNDIRSIVDQYHRCGNRTARLPEKLLEIINQAIDKIYLTEERGTVQDTLDHAITEVKRENVLRIATKQLPMPSLRQVKRLIDAIPAYDRYAARHGRRAADIYFRSVKKAPGTSLPLERVEIDHTRVDVFVVDEQTMLPLGRPWLTLCIDTHTRSILGFDLSFDPPSHLTVARCLRHAMLPKGDLQGAFPAVAGTWDMFGIMDTLVCDNGPEFHGDSLELACLSMGITLQFCPRKQPWFKGCVERTLGTTNRGIAHGIPGTTFSNILEKKDYNAAAKATVTLSTLREIIHVWIVDYYHQRPHKTLGDTPAHAWHVETVGLDIPVPSDPDELKAVLGKASSRRLTHKGIEINSLFYNCPAVQEVSRRLGCDLTVTVRYQEDDLGEIHLLVPDTDEYLAVPALDQDYARGLTLWQHKVCRRFAKRQLEGRTDTVALAEAKRRISELVSKDFARKGHKTRCRSARFPIDQANQPSTVADPSKPVMPPPCSEAEPEAADGSADHHDEDTPVRRFNPMITACRPADIFPR